MADYPTAIWTPTNPSGGDLLSSGHAAGHATVNNEVAAVEAELGVSPSGTYDTLVQRLDAMVSLMWPVDSIYFSTSATNPATTLGFGTWVAWGSGRVPVGVDTGQTEFDTVEETGGAKTHTLTTSEIPSHNHTQNPHNHDIRGADATVTAGSATGRVPFTPSGGSIITADGNYNRSATATNQATGGGQAHNNLQPYITCYMWKRTA